MLLDKSDLTLLRRRYGDYFRRFLRGFAVARLSKLFSFTNWAASRPSSPVPGDKLDEELANHRKAVNDLDHELADIRRSDGRLVDGIVDAAALAPDLLQKLQADADRVAAPAVQAAAAARSTLSVMEQAALEAARRAEAAAARAVAAEAILDASTGSVLDEVQDARLKTNEDLVESRALVVGLANSTNAAQGFAAKASNYAKLTQLWAEWMGNGSSDQTLPPNMLKEMGISGSHWSARWWASRAENAFGHLTELYLGVHATPPTTTSTGGPIVHGAIYYNSVTKRPYVWDNGSWAPFYQPAKAIAQTLIYRSGTADTDYDLGNPDVNGGTFTFDDPAEPCEVYVNGVRMTPRIGSLTNTGDYEVDGNQNIIRFFRPITPHSVVTVDILVPPSKMQPGTVNFHHLHNIDLDPTTLQPGRVDGVLKTFTLAAIDTTTMNIGSPQEMLVSIDGVIQQPGVDFTAAGSTVQFTEAPATDSKVWMIWFEPGGSGGGKGVMPPVPPKDAHINSYEWLPGLGGMWIDSRGAMRSVRNEADLRGLSDPEYIKPGSLALVENTLDIWIYQNDPLPSMGRHWEKYLPHHGNGPIRQRMVFDPAKPLGARTEWRDDRATLESVDLLIDLNDRTKLPLSHIKQGKLVFVKEVDCLYVLEVDGANVTNQLQDWKPISGAATYIGRVGNLPDPATTNLADGQTFVIRMDVAGNDIYRLVSYEKASGGYKYLTHDTRLKALRSDADYVDSRPDDLQITTEAGHAEIKVNTAAGWHTVFSEDDVKAWIASLSLFEGTASEVGNTTAVGSIELNHLPDLAALTTAKDLGKVSHYWTWVGAAGYVVAPNTPRIGTDLAGATLQPGDWIQISNAGSAAAPALHYSHIGGDLLVKSRGDKLYGLQPWVAGAWEQGALCVFEGGIFRAARAVLPADTNPTTVGGAWTKLAIGDGIKVVMSDGDRPATAPSTVPYLVVASGSNGGKPAWYCYDTGAGRWSQIGGGGEGFAMKFDTGGTIVYPDNLLWDGAATAPTPKIAGDLLINTAKKSIERVSVDGASWLNLVAGGGAQHWDGVSARPSPESGSSILVNTQKKGIVAYAVNGAWVDIELGAVIQPPRFIAMPNRVDIRVPGSGSWLTQVVQTASLTGLIVGHTYRVDYFCNIVTMSNAKWGFKIQLRGQTNREVQIQDRTNMQTAALMMMFTATSTSHDIDAKFLSSPNGQRFIAGGDFGELSGTTGTTCGGFSIQDIGA